MRRNRSKRGITQKGTGLRTKSRTSLKHPYEIYQDHICSCALRVAREVSKLFPIETVIITVLDNLLNTQTGFLEKQPILSVAIPKTTINKLNFSQLDPSDAMKNFICNMNFKKTKGFEVVERIKDEKIKTV